MATMRTPQGTAPELAMVPPALRPELMDAGLQRALAAVAHGARPGEDLRSAVGRCARQARQRDVGAREVAAQLVAQSRAPLSGLPIGIRREVEHQIGWWVAQEYHRDD